MKEPTHVVKWFSCGAALRVASFLLIICFLFSLLASTPTAFQLPNEIVRLNPMGGPGGNYFEYMCGPGRVLVGLRGYAGVWIDNVQAICASVDLNGVELSNSQPEGPVFGGDRAVDK